MPIKRISFADALSATATRRRHLLLGNGFSIGLFPDRFRYGSLLRQADFSAAAEAERVFGVMGTENFEAVIKALRTFASVAPIYGGGELSAKALLHADRLKEVLVEAIAGHHPERPGDIEEEQYRACRTFLAHFIGEARGARLGQVFTLNYDLLLYWALCHEFPTAPSDLAVEYTDGFGKPDDADETGYVQWGARAHETYQVTYLHGALHLYEAGPEVRKMSWEQTNIPLIEQIDAAMGADAFPLFVAEGDAADKLKRIRSNGYLFHSERKFARVCDTANSALFVFGHSLSESDGHVLRMIEDGTVERLYISIYGTPDSPDNQQILHRAEQLISRRGEKAPLQVWWFDAAEAEVWG